MLTVGSLFAGIGGFDLGLERTGGFRTVWQCEIDPFCLKVLEKHWPDVKRFTDIKKMGIEEEIPYVDVICGGFPCQPVSCAGKRKGTEDERWLWPEFYRIICSVKPRWVLVENVPGLFSAKDTEGNKGALFGGILRDLAEIGYNAKWQIVSAASVGAPHLRKRVFIVAHTDRTGSGGEDRDAIHEGRPACESGRTGLQEEARRDNDFAISDVGATGEVLAHAPSQQNNPECQGCRGSSEQQGRTLADGGEALRPENGQASNNVPGDAVRMWPTPTTRDACNNAGPSQMNRHSLPLNAAVGGILNPDWVELLMGFPLGWTLPGNSDGKMEFQE